MHILDRRLNPGGKSLENRQRFLRRAKALVRARSASPPRPRHQGRPGRRRGRHSGRRRATSRASHRGGRLRDRVLPGNKKFVEGDCLPRRDRAVAAAIRGAGEGDGEDAFRFVLTREEFLDLFLDDLELPDLAKRKLAEAESEGLRRAGYAVSGSPSNIAVTRTMRLAMARRIALAPAAPEAIARLEEELADDASDEERRTSCGPRSRR